MLIKIKYHDSDALTIEEIVRNNKETHGDACTVSVLPDSMLPHDLVQFALWQMTGLRQTEIFYNDPDLYHKKLKELRAETLYKLEELLDETLLENEDRLTKE